MAADPAAAAQQLEALAPFVEALTQAVQRGGQPAFDSRSVGKLSEFSGRDGDWSLWSFVLEAHIGLLREGASVLPEAAMDAQEAPALRDMSGPVATLANKIYILLVASVKNKALNLLRSVERNNGFAAYCTLKELSLIHI